MTNGNRPLGRLLILLVVLIGIEVVALGGAVATSYRSADSQGPVAFVIDGVQAVTKVAITVAGVAGKILAVLAAQAHGDQAHAVGVVLPAAASTGGAHLGYIAVSEDCCGPGTARGRDEAQASRTAQSIKSRS